MKPTLTVVCPAYNEEAVIGKFYGELQSVLTSLNGRYESTMLFVVDRCTDNTLDVLKDIAGKDPRVKILSLSSRFGHQMSLLAGMDHSSSDAVIMMDTDLQHPPAIIPSMLGEFEKGYDVVYTIRQDAPDTGLLKRISSKLFYRMINRVSNVPINESAADFRLLSRRVVDIFKKQIRERNQFLRGLVSWVGFRSIGIEFGAMKRAAGKGKYSISRMVRFGVQGIISFSKRPLQAAVLVGVMFAVFGFINAVFTFVQYFLNDSLPSGWTTLTILISIFSGVQLIFLGIIGEYIAAIFDEVKGRPLYIVEEQINFHDE